jgi:hypothetical protein
MEFEKAYCVCACALQHSNSVVKLEDITLSPWQIN